MRFIDHGLNHRTCIKNAVYGGFLSHGGTPSHHPSHDQTKSDLEWWRLGIHLRKTPFFSVILQTLRWKMHHLLRGFLPLEQHVIFMWCSIANCQITRGSPMTQPILDRYLCVMDCQRFSKINVKIPIQRRKGTLLKHSELPDTNWSLYI